MSPYPIHTKCLLFILGLTFGAWLATSSVAQEDAGTLPEDANASETQADDDAPSENKLRDADTEAKAEEKKITQTLAAGSDKYVWILNREGKENKLYYAPQKTEKPARRFVTKGSESEEAEDGEGKSEKKIYSVPVKIAGKPIAMVCHDRTVYILLIHNHQRTLQSVTINPSALKPSEIYRQKLHPKIKPGLFIDIAPASSGPMILLKRKRIPAEEAGPEGDAKADDYNNVKSTAAEKTEEVKSAAEGDTGGHKDERIIQAQDEPEDKADGASENDARNDEDAEAPSPSSVDYQLYRLERNQWVEHSLPSELGRISVDRSATVAKTLPVLKLTVISGNQEHPAILQNSSGGTAVLWQYEADTNSWTSKPYPVKVTQNTQLISGKGLTVLGNPERDGDEGGSLNLQIIRKGESFPLARIPLEANERCRLINTENDIALICTHENKQRITPLSLTGDVNQPIEPAELTVSTPRSQQEHPLYYVMWGTMILSVILVLTTNTRDMKAGPPRLPKHLVAAPFFKRIIAAFVDTFPASILTSALFEIESMADFQALNDPSVDPWDFTIVFMTMFGAYVVWCIVFEVTMQRSPGKMLLGLTVVNDRGQKASVFAIILRNLLKIIDVLIPLLVVMVFLNIHRQRLGDLIARTIVVSPRPPSHGDPNQITIQPLDPQQGGSSDVPPEPDHQRPDSPDQPNTKPGDGNESEAGGERNDRWGR